MLSYPSRIGLKTAAFLMVLCCVLFVHAAVPFVSIPTLGQALWASGFAQSYVNQSWAALYATDFGLPKPAAIAFGLSGTFVQSLFIRVFGTSPTDAYTLTVVFYLGCALYGAAAMARTLGASYFFSLVLGLLWLALPIVWGHSGYSMVSLGFALIPLYLHAAGKLITDNGRARRLNDAVGFALACVIAIFMDGYTFMMFLASTAILWTGSLLWNPPSRRHLLRFALPVILAGFSLSYALYTSFVGPPHHTLSPPDFFRGWGVDVTMLLAPTRGVVWLWDLFGFTVSRNEHMFWGDGSVWMTTFVLPLAVLGFAGYVIATDRKLATVLLTVALVGAYLSLGPSLKVNSTKQVEGISAADAGQLMPEKYALAPTGTAVLSQHLPGFSDMRAAYRWMGMGAFGLWGLSTLFAVWLNGRHRAFGYIVVLLAIAMFLPHVQERFKQAVRNRQSVDAIDTDLLHDVRAAVGDGNTALFVPYGNDFLVGYLAAVGGFKAYNIGGDKNLAEARTAWSDAVLTLDGAHLRSEGFWRNIQLVLLRGEADIIVLPYFDPLWSAHAWPPSSITVNARREQLLPIARKAAASDCFLLTDTRLFATVSLTDAVKKTIEQVRIEQSAADDQSMLRARCAGRY